MPNLNQPPNDQTNNFPYINPLNISSNHSHVPPPSNLNYRNFAQYDSQQHQQTPLVYFAQPSSSPILYPV